MRIPRLELRRDTRRGRAIVEDFTNRMLKDVHDRQSRRWTKNCNERVPTPSNERCEHYMIATDPLAADVAYPWQIERRDPQYRPPSSRLQSRSLPKPKTGSMTPQRWIEALRENCGIPNSCSKPLSSKLARFNSLDWGSCIRLAQRRT